MIKDNRILLLSDAETFRAQCKLNNECIVLTNGCFDILHSGHVAYLEASASLGDRLLVGINSDKSVAALKGPDRPVNSELDRACIVAALRCVDAVFIFPGPRLANEIRAIRPDVYTKAGDYTPETLEESEKRALDDVGANIRIMPFKAGYSSTLTIEKTAASTESHVDRLCFRETLRCMSRVISDCESLNFGVAQAVQMILDCLKRGGKLLTCGNGGSAADALHLAEELVGRYRLDRRSLPAVCLNADPTSITCIANDYGFEKIFSRPLESLGSSGDVLVAFTTSGNSENVISAIHRAREKGIKTILLAGKDGGRARGITDCEIIVPSNDTARIQEVHTLVLHHWLEHIDACFFEG